MRTRNSINIDSIESELSNEYKAKTILSNYLVQCVPPSPTTFIGLADPLSPPKTEM